MPSSFNSTRSMTAQACGTSAADRSKKTSVRLFIRAPSNSKLARDAETHSLRTCRWELGAQPKMQARTWAKVCCHARRKNRSPAAHNDRAGHAVPRRLTPCQCGTDEPFLIDQPRLIGTIRYPQARFQYIAAPELLRSFGS